MLKYFLISSFNLILIQILSELISNETKEKKFLIGSIFLFLGLFLFQGFLWSSGEIRNYPNLAFTHVLGVLLMGPFFERFICLILEIETIPLKKFFKKLLLISTLFIFILPYYFLNTEKKLEIIEKNYTGEGLIRNKFILFFYASFLLFYFFKIFFRFKNQFNIYSIRRNETLILITLIILLGILSSIIAIIFIFLIPILGLYLNSILIGIFLVFYQISLKKFPSILKNLKQIIEEEKKYKISQIKKLNLEELKNKLNFLMEIEKIYYDDEFSLTDLAKKLELSTHQISEFLNQEMKISFFQFVNKYRVNEVKKLILEKKHNTVLSIAFEVGFNSKSSFNETFKKETGLTPTEYKKLNLKKT